MKRTKLFSLFLIFCFLSGCCGIKEACRGFLGVSTKILEDTRKDALKKDFSGDFEVIHQKIKNALKSEGAYIYRDDPLQHLIALYLSEKDTTPVGVFLTGIDKNNTRVEVSSPSTYAKELIAQVIFDSLSGTVRAKKGKGIIDAKKTKLFGKPAN